jgi:hypothetical protein
VSDFLCISAHGSRLTAKSVRRRLNLPISLCCMSSSVNSSCWELQLLAPEETGWGGGAPGTLKHLWFVQILGAIDGRIPGGGAWRS